MKYFKAILLVSLLSISGQVLGWSCPPEDSLLFCKCRDGKVTCDIHDVAPEDIDLATDFETIQAGHNRGDQVFDRFELNSNTITDLAADVFSGVAFREIVFDSCPSLGCVDPRAFAGMEIWTNRFIAKGTDFSNLTTTPKLCNIFSAISTLINLERVNITGSSIKAIPEKAFRAKVGTLEHLEQISFSDGRSGSIATIGDSAFSQLKNLRYLDLAYHKISKIQNNAFSFIEQTNNELTINLEHNNLNGYSFGTIGTGGVFGTGNRRVLIRLGKNPTLKWLASEAFQTFLANGLNGPEWNKIDLKGTSLQICEQNKWLIEYKVALNLAAKITTIVSDDNEDFWRHSPNSKPFKTPGTTPVPPTTVNGTSNHTNPYFDDY